MVTEWARGRAAMVSARWAAVRRATLALAAPLSAEDAMLQSMPEASPAKWHLGHTTWFFETFVLARAEPGIPPFHPSYAFLFNSYYETLGPRQPRPQRGTRSSTRSCSWTAEGRGWTQFTLGGTRPVDEAEPVAHVSYYEADAYARWAGARLPSEEEWEAAAAGLEADGTFADAGRLHPAPARRGEGLRQLLGDVWEWTRSAYAPYPGFRPEAGALGEYNGKFMVSQLVLRGGSCATPPGHVRASYRNFFYPDARWQFSGARLARDA